MPSRTQDGRFRGVVTRGGKKIKQRLFRLKRDAAKWEKDELEKIIAAESAEATPTGTDFLTCYNQYLDWVRVQFPGRSYSKKKYHIGRFVKYLGGNMLLAEIKKADIQNFMMDSAENGPGPRVANNDRKHISAMFNWAIDNDDMPDVTTNPASRVKKLPIGTRAPQYTPPEKDVLKVLAATTGTDRIFLEAYIKTGARRSELLRLTWDDVNFETCMVQLFTKKTKDSSLEGEWIPVPASLMSSLKRLWKTRKFKDSPFVFTCETRGSYYGRPYSLREHFMRSACKRAGVRQFGFHALRRFFASMLADKYKHSTKTVQGLLRHKKHETTERYLHRIHSDLSVAVSDLDGFGSEETGEKNAPINAPEGKKKA